MHNVSAWNSDDGDIPINDGNITMTLISTESQSDILELTTHVLALEKRVESVFAEIWNVRMTVKVAITLRIMQTADISSVRVGDGDFGGTHFHLHIIWVIMLSVATCFCLVGTTLMLCVLPSIRQQPGTKHKGPPPLTFGVDGDSRCASRCGVDGDHGTN